MSIGRPYAMYNECTMRACGFIAHCVCTYAHVVSYTIYVFACYKVYYLSGLTNVLTTSNFSFLYQLLFARPIEQLCNKLASNYLVFGSSVSTLYGMQACSCVYSDNL